VIAPHHSGPRPLGSPLTPPKKTLGPRPQPKSVVHSGHGLVTKLDDRPRPSPTRAWFHGQAVDSIGRVWFGTFLTKLPIKAVFPCTRARTRARCTDLSTSGVDNGKTPIGTATCGPLVGNDGTVARKRTCFVTGCAVGRRMSRAGRARPVSRPHTAKP